jgi:hypothetical protein
MYVNPKMILVETIQLAWEEERGREGIKESRGSGEFKYDIFDTL